MNSILKKILSYHPQYIFLVISITFGTLSAALVPQLSGNDEQAHFYRSYSIASGNISGESCSFPEEIITKTELSRNDKFFFTLSEKTSNNIRSHDCGSAGVYSPIMHAPQAFGITIGRIFYNSPAMLVLFGRLANLIFFSVSLFFIIKHARVGKWALFVIGLLPSSIHIASSLSYDTFNLVVVLAFIVFVINLYSHKNIASKKQLVFLASLAILTCVSKTTNSSLMLLLLAVPSRSFSSVPIKTNPFIKKIITISLIGILCVLFIYSWQKFSGSSLPAIQSNKLFSNPLYFFVVVYNTYLNPFLGYGDLLIRGVIGDFASFKYHLPTFTIVIAYTLLFLSLTTPHSLENKDNIKRTKRYTAITSSVFVISCIFITLALYLAWATLPKRLGPDAIYADGVQGRYFIPLIALLIPLGVSIRDYVSLIAKRPLIKEGVIIGGSIFLLIFYISQTMIYLI